MGKIKSLSRRIGRSGAVAIVTAVCLPILVMIVGFAADYGYAAYINQRLARATDSATLGSVSQTAATTAGGYSNLSGLQTIGVNYFNANIAQLPVTNVSFSLSVVSDGSGGVIATGSYTYNSPTFFGGAIGFSNVPLSGIAKTTARPLVYVNYYILVDASQSMGIASTASDMTRLYNLVVSSGNGSGGEAGCVFGCHVTAPGQKVTNESLAHSASPPITLRIDSAVTAIQGIISSAQSVASTTKNIQFALYKIQQDPSNNQMLAQVASLSNNYTTLNTAASTIELGNNNSSGVGDSDFHDELAAFNTLLTQNGITSNGSGASATSPLNYFFIVTDGAADTFSNSCGYGHCTSAFNASDCTALKSKGTVGVIYTTYLPIYNNNNSANGLEAAYRDLVAPFVNQIGPSLQNCVTSSDYYFQATEGPEIIAAMQSLFQRTQPSSARIAQ